MTGIRSMTAADAVDGMRLKDEAGWNQVLADWDRFLDLADGRCFVAVDRGRVVGSVTTSRFGTVGWVAMLLVAGEHRGRGIGTSLLRRALDRLEADGVRSVRLDATPAGRPLYESLGFRVDFPLYRYAGTTTGSSRDANIRVGRPEDRAEVATLDRSATCTGRRRLIDRLIDDNPERFLVCGPDEGPIRGFALWRTGSSADQVGPCIADRDSGRALLDAAAAGLGDRPMIVDIPTDHGAAIAWAEERGLRTIRPLWRMTRGQAVAENLDRIWASSGPEMG